MLSNWQCKCASSFTPLLRGKKERLEVVFLQFEPLIKGPSEKRIENEYPIVSSN